jgi:transposase InsO family protein
MSGRSSCMSQVQLFQGVVFIDDILIYSKTAEEHTELVEWVLRRLEEEGYYAHPDKCEFFQKEVSFLGHIVSEKGVAVQLHKVRAVTEWPQPKNKREIRAFLGLTNYYRRFIPSFSEIAAPLTDLTGKDVPFCWTEREQLAFELLKLRMTTADVLAHPNPDRPYIVTTDASGFALSGVLSQDQPDGSRRPVAYMSRKLSPAERRYATHDKELLAIVRAVEHWRCYLEGNAHPILLLSDHRSLQHLNTQPNLTDRQARWVEKLSDFEFRIEYIKGNLNRVADELSRRADYEAEASAERATETATNRDDEPPRVKLIQQTERVNTTTTTTTTTNDDTKEDEVRAMWQICMDGFPLLDDIKEAARRDDVYQLILAKPQPRDDGLTVGEGLLWTCEGLLYIPTDPTLQQLLIRQVHDSPTGGHMGLAKTMARLTSMCWWPGMKAMIADYVRGCVTCAATKPLLQKPAGTLRPLPIPDKPWRVITIDFVGPFPRTADYFNYVLVVQDKFSKMAHFIATTTNVTAEETALLLLEHVVRLHGLPEAIISDRGHEFTAHLFQQLWTAFGTDLRLSTAYHPQSDGGTERLIRELEQQLRAHANRSGNNWKQWLSIVEMHYNNDRHESTGKTPFEMNGVDWKDQWAVAMASARPRLTNDAAEDLLRDIRTTWEDARQVMIRQRAQQKKFADVKRREERYQVGDQVMLTTDKLAEGRGKLRDRWVGPFTVMEAFRNGVNVRLDLPQQYSKLHPVFHVEKLKRFIPSAMEWPGREQPKRPKARLVNGRRKYWAVRIIDRKEEDVEFTTRVEDTEMPAEHKGDVPDLLVPSNAGRRVSPRNHASTHTGDAPAAPAQRARKPRTRIIKETRRIVSYKVEWEGYGPEDATWKTEEEVIEEGLEWMIRDYEMMLHQQGDELDLGTVCIFSPSMEGGGSRLRCSCS